MTNLRQLKKNTLQASTSIYIQNLIAGKEVLLFRKREEPDSNPGPETGHHDDDFRVFNRNFRP